MTLHWFRSLRMQIGLAVLAIFLVLVGTLGYTLYALKLREHDYLILNLTGQLRVISKTMTEQARRYAEQAPDDYDKYNRDLGTYWQDLQTQSKLYQRIVHSLESRQIDAGLLGHAQHGKIYCTWDDQSRLQMNKSAEVWRQFKTGLDSKLGDNLNEPRLSWAAEYIDSNGDKLVLSSDKLALAFQTMMEEKLDKIRLFQWIAAGISVLFLILVLTLIQRLVINPLNTTIRGFSRIANGDFKYQLPLIENNEIGQMTLAFNRLTERLNSMFRLTDRINQGKKLDETLQFVYEEFQSFVPLDWVGVFYASPDKAYFLLERHFSNQPVSLKDGDSFSALLGCLSNISEKPCSFYKAPGEHGSLNEVLVSNGLLSAVCLPLLSHGINRAVMVFANKEQEYLPEHVEFLTNIGATIAHVLEKTVVTESLVASAVQGLAKLAESRDPETGDHLVRMALYSAFIAEELGRESPYKSKITPAYVRDIHQFAPMHDIGKVGVRDEVLLKPGGLNLDERKEIEKHPSIGGEVLRRCEAQMQAQGQSVFQIGIEIAECHHEKFNGEGYPVGLKGQNIPLSARIVAVADVFDALTSKRPYKEAWLVEEALRVMQEDSGKHFDPVVIAAMLRVLPRMMEVYNRLKHI